MLATGTQRVSDLRDHASDIQGLSMLLHSHQPWWWSQAACLSADPEVFFPLQGGETHSAKRICRRCPVRQECLEHALANSEAFGVWGGLDERDRRRLGQMGSTATRVRRVVV